MSEYNEELLNDADDYPDDLGEADEDALLQDDEDGDDVIDIAPEELALDATTEQDESEEAQRDKFVVERQQITAPEPTEPKPKWPKLNNRGRGRGARFQGNRGRGRHGFTTRNKTVHINPNFPGRVYVDNNAPRLVWDTPPSLNQPQHHNPWATGIPPGQMNPMQPIQGPMAGPPMRAFEAGPPMQQLHYQEPMMQYQQGPMPQFQDLGPPAHHPQYIPQQPYMPQPLPPGVQPPMQANQPNIFMHQPPPNMMMNCNQQVAPHVSTPNYPVFNQQLNQQGNFPPAQPNFNRRQNFPPQNRFSNNNRRPNNNRQELFTQKRKVTANFPKSKKLFIQDRLGPPQQAERMSVVRQVVVTNVTTVKIEDEEDEQTRDLRLKIEEQKRLREAIFRLKEERRLRTLKGQSPAADQESPLQLEMLERQIARPGFKQQQQQQQAPAIEAQGQRPGKPKKNMGNNIVITNGYSRKPTKYQQKKKESNLVVLNRPVPAAPIAVPDPELKLDKEHLSNFLADRKILAKDEGLMSTRKVVIKNISTSTGDKKIFQISRSIGEVQKLHRDNNERQATIIFKSVASAHAFYKKYQRHMLDLSMIEVQLSAMTESDE